MEKTVYRLNWKFIPICVVSLLIWALILLGISKAADYNAPIGRVNDFAHILKPETTRTLEMKLKAVDDKTTNEIVVVTVPDLQGSDIATYSVNLFKKWKIGKANKNNGVILLVALKERKVRIEVGYGLEPILTDALSKRIISNIIIPYLKEKPNPNFDSGVTAGVDAIISTLNKEPISVLAGTDKPVEKTPLSLKAIVGIILIVIVVLIIVGLIGGGDVIAFILGAIIGSIGGGGGSGGGFSGGGGDSGGGGADGGW